MRKINDSLSIRFLWRKNSFSFALKVLLEQKRKEKELEKLN